MKYKTKPFSGQRAGTSGLRAKTRTFMQTNYLQNYIQCCLDQLKSHAHINTSAPLLLGGDGRFFNDRALQISAEVAAGNGFTNLIFAKDGLLSTPAGSYLVEHLEASASFIFSASHNPGGINKDFGIKVNLGSGEPAPLSMTEKIYQQSQSINSYCLKELPTLDLAIIGINVIDGITIEVIDAPKLYADYMQTLFNFKDIKTYLETSPILFDAMNAVTGPYAKEIFINRLSAPSTSVINAQPMSDFGGGHPDPSPTTAPHLNEIAFSSAYQYELIAASDGDGDRNMILGKNIFVSPSDSLAVIAANAQYLPQFKKKCLGVARSMPTSRAVDAVAHRQSITCYETPTGWKFFANLLKAKKIDLCGEESFGTGASHVREKDGIWAILAWLNILASKQCSIKALLHEHWETYGRHYYCRYDYEDLSETVGQNVLDAVAESLTKHIEFDRIKAECGVFDYTDPVDGSVTSSQGWQFIFADQARFIVRQSGTGTSGITIRLYFERFSTDYRHELSSYLKPLAKLAIETLKIKEITGLSAPTNIV